MKSKLFILATLTIICFNNLMAQVPAYTWANTIGGTGDDFANNICTDLNGNVFLGGKTTNPAAVVIKHDALGNFLWSQNMVTSGTGSPSRVCTDHNGNVIIVGSFFGGTATFGSITLTNASTTNNDFFVAKYDSSGNLMWAIREGGTRYEGGGVSADANGNIYVAMNSSSGVITIGGTTFNTPDLLPHSFVIKYDSGGNVVWVKHIDSSNHFAELSAISTDVDGNTFVTGTFKFTFSFDAITLISSDTTSSGPRDIFIVKYDTNGNVVWARQAIGSSGASTRTIFTDSQGSIVLSGQYSGDTLALGTTILTDTSTGLYHYFISKLDTAGTFIWGRSEGISNIELTSGTVIDSTGNVLAIGMFSQPTITIGTTVFTNQGTGRDIYLIKYDTTGNILWADAFGSNNADYAENLAVSPTGAIFLAGYFKGPSITLGTTTLTNSGNNTNEVFLASIGVNTTSIASSIYSNTQTIFYPNPVANNLTITNTSKKELAIKLFDVTGKLILEEKVADRKHTLSLNSIANGIYVVEMQTGNTVSRNKIVKQ